MVGTYDVIVLWLSVLFSLGVVGVCLYRRSFLNYFLVNLYLLFNVAFTVGCYYVYSLYGYRSPEYFYFYYTGDALVTVVGYVLIGSLSNRLFRESAFRQYVQLTLALFFIGVVIVSGIFISGSMGRLYSR